MQGAKTDGSAPKCFKRLAFSKPVSVPRLTAVYVQKQKIFF